MNRTKRLKGVCTHCGGPIEFLADLIGTTAQCPRCRQQTELMLAAPPEEPLVPRRVVVWTVVSIAVLVLGVGGGILALLHYEKVALKKTKQAGFSQSGVAPGFKVTAISVEKGPGASESYVVGAVVNTSSQTRSGVAVEMNLLDVALQKVGVARAYRPTLRAGEKWEFKVPTGDPKAVRAEVTSVKEGQ